MLINRFRVLFRYSRWCNSQMLSVGSIHVQRRSLFLELLEGATPDLPGDSVVVKETKRLVKLLKASPTLFTIQESISNLELEDKEPDDKFFSVAINGLLQYQKWREALVLIQSMETTYNYKPSPYCYYPLLYFLAKQGNKPVVDKILKEDYPKYNISIDVHTLTALISGYSQCKQKKYVRRYVDDLRILKDVNWNDTLHTIVASGFIQSGQLELGVVEIKRMIKKNMNVSPLLNKLLSAYMVQGEVEKAENLFEEMELSPNIKVDGATYCSMINAYMKIGKLDKVSKLLSDMQIHAIQIDLPIITALITGNIANNRIQHAEKLFEEQKNQGNIDSKLYDSMIRAYVEINKPKRCIELLEEAKSKRFLPLRSTYVAIIRCISKNPFPDKASMIENLSSQMTAEGLKPYVLTFKEQELLSKSSKKEEFPHE